MIKEIKNIEKFFEDPKKPILAIIGGSKVSTKLNILEELIKKVDTIIPGGGIANTFLLSSGLPIGKSLAEENMKTDALKISELARKNNVYISLPKDVISENGKSVLNKDVSDILKEDVIKDIGIKTSRIYEKLIAEAGTILWNGPVGVFENTLFENGTKIIAKSIAKTKALTIAGGGDTISAIEKFTNINELDYVSTGGGAFLEFLEGKKLPGIEIIKKNMTAINDNIYRQTKIVATLGPSTSSKEAIEGLIDAGVDVVRLNFSHGDKNSHIERAKLVRKVAKEKHYHVGIIGDLQGPKIRITKFINSKIELMNGCKFTIDDKHPFDQGTHEIVGTTYENLYKQLKTNDILLLDDGRIELKVEKISGSKIITKVLHGGLLYDSKGLNKKGGGLSASAISDKDLDDIKTAAEIGVDYLAVSLQERQKI